MFDPVTAALLRTAPELPGLDPEQLPQLLTRQFADLVTRRLRVTQPDAVAQPSADSWPLGRIADAYELVASTIGDQNLKRAAAFVAGTARQILAQETADQPDDGTPILDRDRVDPALSAALLFLAAEQYADAIEAARNIRVVRGRQDAVSTLLAEYVQDLAAARLHRVLDRANSRPAHFDPPQRLEARGTTALLETLVVAIEVYSAGVLGSPVPESAAGRFETARDAVLLVHELSGGQPDLGDTPVGPLLVTYPGPRHLAVLLLMVFDGTVDAALSSTPPPPDVDTAFWGAWLRHRANFAPFLWSNHRAAIARGFHLPGQSAVMILPTGAGKTTVSCLKIAATLATRKTVIFVAPTHALVEQLVVDLQEIFPEEVLGALVSSDFDRLFAVGTALRPIEVMTPEHCLALLSYAPDAFDEVGLMVFDECHLLCPESGFRRSLDGMFCVLAFNAIAPAADFLFLSAMLRDGSDFADWIASITSRHCVFLDTLWKPSRQARGVVLYRQAALNSAEQAAAETQRATDLALGKQAKSLRKAALEQLLAEPFAVFGLHHNWQTGGGRDLSLAKLTGTQVQLRGELRKFDGTVTAKPNANHVAAHIAAASARNGLKTIVFVNTKPHAVSTARDIAKELPEATHQTRNEQNRWHALEAELGGLEHSLLEEGAAAVPHHADMLRLERDLAERLFRRADGAQVIVATPTLAQGLNLPAHLAILASDMRADSRGRRSLGAHEIINAAGRAGRAGHLANGVVLLIPDHVFSFSEEGTLAAGTLARLGKVLPEDDRCLSITDPLQIVLDRIQDASSDLDIDYALNRLSTTILSQSQRSQDAMAVSVTKSLAAYRATLANTTDQFDRKVARLSEHLAERTAGAQDDTLLQLAAQSGAPLYVLDALRVRLSATTDTLPPATVLDWVTWAFEWLAEDEQARHALFSRDTDSVLRAVGRKMSEPLSGDAMLDLLPGVQSWLSGQPLRAIETALAGDPTVRKGRTCPRARTLVTSLVPMPLTFLFGLVSRAAEGVAGLTDDQANSTRVTLECLPTAVRRGFDSPTTLAFAESRSFASRVLAHRAFAEAPHSDLPVDDAIDYGALVSLMGQSR